jgi:hypothetical protein
MLLLEFCWNFQLVAGTVVLSKNIPNHHHNRLQNRPKDSNSEESRNFREFQFSILQNSILEIPGRTIFCKISDSAEHRRNRPKQTKKIIFLRKWKSIHIFMPYSSVCACSPVVNIGELIEMEESCYTYYLHFNRRVICFNCFLLDYSGAIIFLLQAAQLIKCSAGRLL